MRCGFNRSTQHFSLFGKLECEACSIVAEYFFPDMQKSELWDRWQRGEIDDLDWTWF